MKLLKIRAVGASSPGKRKSESLSPIRRRKWSIRYLFGILSVLVFVPQLVYKASLQREEILHATTIFGDNLHPTPWHWHENPLGPDKFTWKRSLKIQKCAIRSWISPLPRTVSYIETNPTNIDCPTFFQWIRSDLSPWVKTGITLENVAAAKQHAAFRVTIVGGKLHLDLYHSCVQTRALLTVWGLLLLLEKYPGLVPDADLMFDCMDRPHLEKVESSPEFASPPVLFRYCSTKNHYDIPFPDWSFWGWSETKLEPWDEQREKIVRVSKRTEWKGKIAKAFWRGNPDVGSPLRMELLKCNNATGWSPSRSEIHNQVWDKELADSEGVHKSKLENQCKHRYKIYAEGFAWSVSFKYIMACGSPTLAISPAYHDFFMRGLQSWVHYIPVRPSEICAKKVCSSINSAVKWGEAYSSKALAIGQAGQEFLRKDLSMNNVYDYMFHLISEYATLQTFKPVVPASAQEVTQNFIFCIASPEVSTLLQKSRAAMKIGSPPCQFVKSTQVFRDIDWEVKDHSTGDRSEQQCTS